jgi:hypothetical protein
MRKTKLHARTASAIALLLAATSIASAQQPLLLRSVASAVQTQKRLIRITVSAESTVTISADVPIADAVSYKSGERFVVIIPQASAASVEGDSGNRNFKNFQIEQRGDDVSISFLLMPGTVARLEQKVNGVSVVFSSLAASTETPVAQPEAPAITSSQPGSTSPRDEAPRLTLESAVVPAVTSPPSMSSPPQQGDIAEFLNGLFPGASHKIKADAGNVDLSVPESPAFTVLGLTPNTVVRPGSPRAFASSLLNGLDQNGNFQSGLAIDTAPFMLFNGENVTIIDYNKHYVTRFLARTQFSFATAKGGSSDDTATRLSAGLNLTLWDEGDPRIYHPERGDDDVLQCFAKGLKDPPVIAPGTPPETVARINAENKAINDTLADACRERARKANWNRSSWVIAYAPSWISKTGEARGFRWNGGAFWTSVAYGFEGLPSLERIGQLIFHVRHRTREQVPDPANQGKFLTQNSTFFGARFRAGSPKFALNFEDSYIRSRVLGGKIDHINRFSIGAEARITDNLYFVITSGSNLNSDVSGNKGFLMSSFKYGFSRKSQFNPQP